MGVNIEGHIFLTGIMGCGKSSIGRQLASLYQRTFLDLDEHIEHVQNCTISEIFKNRGEAYFRDLETSALKQIASKKNHTKLVIATGGGIVLRPENVQFMSMMGTIVWIDRPLENILDDIALSNRPVLAGDKNQLKKVMQERQAIYHQSAHIHFSNQYSNADAACIVLSKLLER